MADHLNDHQARHDAVPDGPPRAVVEYWHTAALEYAALERSDGGTHCEWTTVAHVTATILSAMDAEPDALAEQELRLRQTWGAEAADRIRELVPESLKQAADRTATAEAEAGRLRALLGRAEIQWGNRAAGDDRVHIDDEDICRRRAQLTYGPWWCVVRRTIHPEPWEHIFGCPCPTGMKYHALNCPVLPGQPMIFDLS